jgi:Tfp pilus assembly protein FimT
VAILAILSAAIISSFSSASQARSVTEAVHQLSDLFGLARSTAVAQDTYVWVGCRSTNVSGMFELQVGAVYSRDGSTNARSDNLAPITRLVRLQGLVLTTRQELKPTTAALFQNISTESLATNQRGIDFFLGDAHFEGATVTFTPRGQILLSGTPDRFEGFVPYIDVSLRHARGTLVLPDADDAAVILDGSSGQAEMLQLR